MALPRGSQYAMCATAPRLKNMTANQIQAVIQAQVHDAGFGKSGGGLHVPLEWTYDARITDMQRQADEEGWHIVYWCFGNAQWGTAPGRGEMDSQPSKDHQRRVGDALGPFTNWSMGMQFDAQEDRTHAEVAAWTHEWRTDYAPNHHYFCRAQMSDGPYAGQCISAEQHFIDRTPAGVHRVIDNLEALQEPGKNKPLISGDRLRIRIPPKYPKDFQSFKEVEGALWIFMLRRVTAYWGWNPNGAVSDLGAAPWPNAAILNEIMSSQPDPDPPSPIELALAALTKADGGSSLARQQIAEARLQIEKLL